MVEQRLKFMERAAILSRVVPHVISSSRRSRMSEDDDASSRESDITTSFRQFLFDTDYDASSLYEVHSTRKITYITPIGTAYGVEVAREVEIMLTNDRFELCAADLGAFPFQPGETIDSSHAWFDAKLLDHYAELHHRKAFISHAHLQDVFNKLTGVRISRMDWSNIVRQYRATVRPSEIAQLKHFDVDLPSEVENDPLKDCPACAIVPEYQGELDTDEADRKYSHMPLDGKKDERLDHFKEVGLSPRRSIQVLSCDAVAKGIRFKLNRRDDSKTKLLCSDYILPVDRLTTLMANGAQIVDDDGDTECEQRIRASRDPDANIPGSSKLAEHCIAAAICPHGFVPRNGVVSSDKPENFALYFAILGELLPYRTPCFVCIDNGCQVGPSWRKRFPNLVADNPMLAFTTGSWHGAAHKLSCRMRSSMTFQSGAGRRHGENTEHLWSYLKPLWKSSKYMNFANHKFAVEEGIWGFTCLKRVGLLNQMQAWMKQLPKKKESLTQKRDAIRLELLAQGLDDEAVLKLAYRFRRDAHGIATDDGDLFGEEDTETQFSQCLIEYVKFTEKAKYFTAHKPHRETQTPYGKMKQEAATIAVESESKARAALRASQIDEAIITQDAYSDAHRRHIRQEVASSRVEVETLFETRHALYKSQNRADKYGEHILSRQIKRSLTVNERHIRESLFKIDYWEELHGVHDDENFMYERYEEAEDIDNWMRKHDELFFPPWRQLVDKDGMPLDIRQDGCQSATIRYHIICLIVCLEDITRPEEEARFLPLELHRITFFYLYRKRILNETLHDIHSELKEQEADFPADLVDCDYSELFCERGRETIKSWVQSQRETGLLRNFQLRARAHGIRKLLNHTEQMLQHPVLNAEGEVLCRRLEIEVNSS